MPRCTFLTTTEVKNANFSGASPLGLIEGLTAPPTPQLLQTRYTPYGSSACIARFAHFCNSPGATLYSPVSVRQTRTPGWLWQFSKFRELNFMLNPNFYNWRFLVIFGRINRHACFLRERIIINMIASFYIIRIHNTYMTIEGPGSAMIKIFEKFNLD